MHRSPEAEGNVPGSLILRFDRIERLAHWANAVLFIMLMLTALPLYFVQVEALVGRRALVAEIHTWVGICLPIPLLFSLAGSWGSRLRGDIKEFSRWTLEEVAWLRSFGRHKVSELGKFNPGQKMNALFTGSSILIMFCTGFVLHWFGFFPVAWRTGATFVHDVFAAAILVVFLGHLLFALTHRESLKSIFRGYVSENWAALHWTRWFSERRSSERGISS